MCAGWHEHRHGLIFQQQVLHFFVMNQILVKLSWFLVITARSEGIISGRTTCGSGTIVNQARVACHFSQNVGEAQEVDVLLLHRLSIHNASRNPEKVVRCYRFPGNGFDCIPTDGYTTNGSITDQMIIDIPTARPDHQGTYFCEMLSGNATFRTKSCTLEYTDTLTGKAICESGGLGKHARVTCHFSQDVAEAQEVKIVLLQRLSLHSSSRNPEKVVRCYRFPGNGFDCIPTDGYSNNGSITDQMIIDIPAARPDHMGTYFCKTLPETTSFLMEKCTLEYADAVPDVSRGSAPPSKQESNYHPNRDDDTRFWDKAAPAVVVIASMVCALVWGVQLGIKRRRSRKRGVGANQLLGYLQVLLPRTDNFVNDPVPAAGDVELPPPPYNESA